MILISILAVVAVPRFFDADMYQLRGFYDRVHTSLRYAHKVALAQNRFVCAAFTSTSMTLTIGSTSACGTALAMPTGEASTVVEAPSGVSFLSTPTDFYFDSSGAPSVGQVIQVSGETATITIEATTGYIH